MSEEGSDRERDDEPRKRSDGEEDVGFESEEPEEISDRNNGVGSKGEEDGSEGESGASWIVMVQDAAISLLIVLGIALVLYAVSGIWPPMVAIETGSMEPHLVRGDLVFVSSPDNFVPDEVNTTAGVVTYQQGKKVGYERFGEYGDVIVYQPNGDTGRQSIIHRARKYVEKGETVEVTNGTIKANYSGFVTKGDNNRIYDQQEPGQLSWIVKPEWVKGKAIYAVPYLGKIRLLFPVSSGVERGYVEYLKDSPYVQQKIVEAGDRTENGDAEMSVERRDGSEVSEGMVTTGSVEKFGGWASQVVGAATSENEGSSGGVVSGKAAG